MTFQATRRSDFTASLQADFEETKVKVDALLRVACNTGNSLTLRYMACEHIAYKVSDMPALGRYAVDVLLAKRAAGVPAETVFDALITIIREARDTDNNIFSDAVGSVACQDAAQRAAAAQSLSQAFGVSSKTPLPAVASAR